MVVRRQDYSRVRIKKKKKRIEGAHQEKGTEGGRDHRGRQTGPDAISLDCMVPRCICKRALNIREGKE